MTSAREVSLVGVEMSMRRTMAEGDGAEAGVNELIRTAMKTMDDYEYDRARRQSGGGGRRGWQV